DDLQMERGPKEETVIGFWMHGCRHKREYAAKLLVQIQRALVTHGSYIHWVFM
ncbi:hypothetical protein DNTS_001985, partial [Danionella cerebrum]